MGPQWGALQLFKHELDVAVLYFLEGFEYVWFVLLLAAFHFNIQIISTILL